MITRDSVQGFIDGYLKAGGDATKIETDIGDWMLNHPVYPQTAQLQFVILADLSSYRGVPQPVPVATPIPVVTPVEEVPPA